MSTICAYMSICLKHCRAYNGGGHACATIYNIYREAVFGAHPK